MVSETKKQGGLSPRKRAAAAVVAGSVVLASAVVTRGTVSASQTVGLAPVGATVDGSAAPVVTKMMVRSGKTSPPGQVLVEVSGRPVFALPGALPVYCDLKPGSHGDYVRQLQQALTSAGHSTGSDPSGTYGPDTTQAIGPLYAAIGYDPVPASGVTEGADGDPVYVARDGVKQTQRQLDGLLRTEPGKERDADAGRCAREDLAEARRYLAEAEAKLGPMVPASELVFLSGFPARVDSLPAKVGQNLATVSAGRLVAKALLGAQDQGLIRSGQKVKALPEVYGDKVTATPTAAEGGDQGAAADSQGYAVVVGSVAPLPARLAGQDVRLTIEAATSGKKVVVVPVAALSARADSRTSGTVLDASGGRRRVEARAGTSGGGFTEVVPAEGAPLAPGDKVAVGVAR